MALHLFSAFLSWIDLVCVCLCKGNLEKHGGICLMVAFRDKFQKYFSVLFCDHLNIFRANWEEGVFRHYKVVPRGLWVDFENKGFNLMCFDFNDGLVEFDPVVEALTPQAHFFPSALACCVFSSVPSSVLRYIGVSDRSSPFDPEESWIQGKNHHKFYRSAPLPLHCRANCKH